MFMIVAFIISIVQVACSYDYIGSYLMVKLVLMMSLFMWCKVKLSCTIAIR